MKNSEVKFKIELDDKNIPEKISWDATDKPQDSDTDTRAIALALWDHKVLNTMRIDIWTKEMTIDDMKRFYINAIGGMGDSLRQATSDHGLCDMIDQFCRDMVKHIEKEAGPNS